MDGEISENNMVDGYNLGQAGTMSPEEFAQQQQLNRQQQMAALLMQQGQKQTQGQMIGNRYVAPSFFQNILPLVQTAVGTYLGGKADTEAAKLAQAIRLNKADVEQEIINKLSPQPAKEAGIIGPDGKRTLQTTADMYGADMQLNPAYRKVEAQQERGPDYAGALKIINVNPYSAGKEMRAEILKKQLGPEDTSDYRNYLKVKPEFDAKGIPLTFNEYQDIEANRKRPVTNVSVNTGQHGFENALKLRSDFRNEPIYKGFEEVKAANLQIQQAAKMGTPAGDLAAATKIMKILDPGSVVRESELGMAMAASGLEDRARNYANMIITGQKLTPTQRKDFTDLGQKLYEVSADQFNTKRGEYAGIAQRNKLDVEAAVGGAAPIGQGGWSVKSVK
jgi:hypothetical protein